MGKDKAYYKLLHEHGGLASDTIRVSSDSIDGTPYLTIDFSIRSQAANVLPAVA